MSADPPPSGVESRLDPTALDATFRALAATLDLGEIVAIVVGHTKRVTTAEGISLLLHDPERGELVFAATETLEEHERASNEAPLPPAVGGMVSPDRLVVPLRGDGRVLGSIDLRRRYDGRPFDDSDRRRAAEIAVEVANTPDLERVAHEPDARQDVFTRLAAAVPSQDAALVVYDQAHRASAFRVSRALRHGMIEGMRLRLGQGIAGWVGLHRQAVNLDDARHDPRHDPRISRRTGLVPRRMLCVPMVCDDTLHGVLQVINKRDGSAFDDDDLRRVQAIADHAARALDHASRAQPAQ